MFSGEYCEISKNTYFEERLQMAASPEPFITTANTMLWAISFLWLVSFLKVVWCQKTDRNWDQKQILDYLI